MIEISPSRGIDLAEEARGVGVPAPPQVPRQRVQPLMRRRDELAERARLADDGRQLRPGHHQHPHVGRIEQPRVDGLNDEDSLQETAIHDRHAQERAIRIFTGLGEVLEPRVPRRVGDELRRQLLGDESGQALGQPHPHAADAVLSQPNGRSQHEVDPIRLQQVDRTDVGLEPALNQVHDVGQRLRRVAPLGDQPGDLFQGPQRRFVLVRDQFAAHASPPGVRCSRRRIPPGCVAPRSDISGIRVPSKNSAFRESPNTAEAGGSRLLDPFMIVIFELKTIHKCLNSGSARTPKSRSESRDRQGGVMACHLLRPTSRRTHRSLTGAEDKRIRDGGKGAGVGSSA